MGFQTLEEVLETKLNDITVEVLKELSGWVPVNGNAEGVVRILVASTLASFVVRQVIVQFFSSYPAAGDLAKVCANRLSSILTTRVIRSGKGRAVLSKSIHSTRNMRHVEDVQFWVVPDLLRMCGVSASKGRKIQHEVVAYLVQLAGSEKLPPETEELASKGVLNAKANGHQFDMWSLD